MKKPLFLFLFALSIISFKEGGTALKQYPTDYFRNPVAHKPLISGTFGELRSNHFHSGIDIKSKSGKIGDPLLACAEGYVSRIAIKGGGYGRALYIDHPNGYTTVYAHMHKFTPEIEAWVKEQHYLQEEFKIDVNPPVGMFSFQKGDVIGKMGNTGYSFGPHLHFEIRDTRTQETINPMLFGLKMTDNVAPKIHQIKVYYLNDKHEAQGSIVKNTPRSKSGRYYVGGDTLTVPAWRMGLAVKAYDHMNGTSNWNGVYGIETYVDDVLVHQTEFEKFDFDDTRYINAHTDYREKLLNKAWFNRCYRMPGNDLPMYPVLQGDGVIPLSSKTQKITLRVSDPFGNTSDLRFWVKRAKDIKAPDGELFNYILPYNEDNYIERNGFSMYMPKGTLYETLYLKYSAVPDESGETYSPVHSIQTKTTPVHDWYTLRMKPIGLPQDKWDKAIIVNCENGKIPVNQGGRIEGDYIVAEARKLGDFCIMVDDKPPSIKPVTFKSNMTGYNKISFKVDDEFETSWKNDRFYWDGYIDGKWVLFERDSRNNVLTHRFEKDLPKGKHTIRLEVRDERKNLAVFEREFTR